MSADHGILVAVVVDPDLSPGFLANTVAILSIGLGAAVPELGGERLTDLTGRIVSVSANRPVPVLRADQAGLSALFMRAFPTPEGACLVPFPRFARQVHAFADYAALLPGRDLADEPLDGLALAGPARWLRSLTGSLPLLR